MDRELEELEQSEPVPRKQRGTRSETKVIPTNGLFARNLKMASGVAVPKQQPADSATGYHPVG